MKRTVDEILSERNARIAAVKEQYTDDAVATSAMCASIINADYLTAESRNIAFADNCITADAVELNKRVNAILVEYADELAAAITAENEAEPIHAEFAWIAEMIDF